MQVEFFHGECKLCETALERWTRLFSVEEMHIHRASECVDGSCCRRAAQVGVKAVPALAVNGRVIFTGVPELDDLERIKVELGLAGAFSSQNENRQGN